MATGTTSGGTMKDQTFTYTSGSTIVKVAPGASHSAAWAAITSTWKAAR